MADRLMNMGHWWNDNRRGKTEVHGGKTNLLPLCTTTERR